MLRWNFFQAYFLTQNGIYYLLFNIRLNVLKLQLRFKFFGDLLLLLLSVMLKSSLPYYEGSRDNGSSFVVDIGVGIDTLFLYSSSMLISNLVDFCSVFLLKSWSLLTFVNYWLGIPVSISLLWFCFDLVLNKIFLGRIVFVVFTSARLIIIESFT